MSRDYEDNYSDYSTTKINNRSSDFIKKWAIIGSAIIFVLLIIAIVLIFIFSNTSQEKEPILTEGEPSQNSTSTGGGFLPGGENDPFNDGTNGNSDQSKNQAESLLFADFYKPEEVNNDYSVLSYDLPINSKSEILNYYYISRRIDLEPYLDDLNNSGMTIIDNPYEKEAKDFYSVYRKLNSEGFPIIITTDFINYYYQNTLKQSFKEIEKNVFYENLWDITKEFYEISSARYRKNFIEKGIVNDPVLEGEKMVASYFAVMLELLKPLDEQINRKTNFSDDTRFSEQESLEFDYVLLDFLKKDVLAEVALIREGKKVEKSPVFFYEKDYADYKIPQDYSNNAKLNNFYLVTKWMNSVFPLFFQGEDCPDCQLDREDWRISMTAANFLARDFFENQKLKNQWASIYKIISFFSGLRQDLTYLHYNEAFEDVFEDREIEEVFSRDNSTWNDDYLKYQNRILEFNFSRLEGSFDRANFNHKKKIGMRMLQENYWPNDFIFSTLTGDKISYRKETRQSPLKFTACENPDKIFAIRCVAMGLDVINLIYPLHFHNYYQENINYSGFDQAYQYLKTELDKFNDYSWLNNTYWSTLHSLNIFLNTPKNSLPVFMNTEDWQKKDINTALGAWVNLHLPADKLVLNSTRNAHSLILGAECNSHNYVEPSIYHVNDLIAKNEMLVSMLSALGLSEQTNIVSSILKDLGENLLNLRMITEKQLKNEALEVKDCEFIEEFSRIYEVEKYSEKEFFLRSETGARIRESIEGIKLLLAVKSFNNNKVITIGPIFNYQEKR